MFSYAVSITDIIDNLDWMMLVEILLAVIPALICITLHELSHGYVAYRLGDDTAKSMGRLTLNPIKHIDLFGLVMMIVFKFGWAKPVPVNMYRFEDPKKGMAITAMAGPISNLLISCIFLFIYGLVFLPLSNTDSVLGIAVLNMLELTAYLSLALAIFNIIPIPPLDGSKVLFSLLSDNAYDKLMRYERYGMILLLIVIASGVLGNPLQTATDWLFDKLTVFFDWGIALVQAAAY